MKSLSVNLKDILKRARNDPNFTKAIIENPEKALWYYDLDSQDLEFIKSLRSQNDIYQLYRDIQYSDGYRPEIPLEGKKQLNIIPYAVSFSVLGFISLIYIVLSFQFPDWLSMVEIRQWIQLNFQLKWFFLALILFGVISFAIVIRKLILVMTSTARELSSIGLVLFSIIFIWLFITMNPTNYIFARLLIALIFTILPATLYSLFVITRGKTLWDEFRNNIARLDPVGYRFVEPIYEKKFTALYGQPDQSGFGSALLQGETSFPVLLATFIIGFGWILFFFIDPIEEIIFSQQRIMGTITPFTFGFLGAYIYSLEVLFRRYVQSDLKSVAYTHMSQRILLTWVWGFVLTQIPLGDARVTRSILAFVVGIFPDVAWQVIQQFIRKGLGKVLPSFNENYPLSEIEGMTIWIEARLMEEDIENIENLVTTNIVDLMLRTNLKPQRIIHWIDQGLLKLHFERKNKTTDPDNKLWQELRKHCIITASDLIFSYQTSSTKSRGAHKVFFNDELDPLVKDLVTSLEDDPNMYHVLAWRQMNADRKEKLPKAVKAVIAKESMPPEKPQIRIPTISSSSLSAQSQPEVEQPIQIVASTVDTSPEFKTTDTSVQDNQNNALSFTQAQSELAQSVVFTETTSQESTAVESPAQDAEKDKPTLLSAQTEPEQPSVAITSASSESKTVEEATQVTSIDLLPPLPVDSAVSTTTAVELQVAETVAQDTLIGEFSLIPAQSDIGQPEKPVADVTTNLPEPEFVDKQTQAEPNDHVSEHEDEQPTQLQPNL